VDISEKVSGEPWAVSSGRAAIASASRTAASRQGGVVVTSRLLLTAHR
jgi:hypothetical protein